MRSRLGTLAAGVFVSAAVAVVVGWSSGTPRLEVRSVIDPYLNMGPTVPVKCPAGWIAIGGGTMSGGALLESYPAPSSQPRQWWVKSETSEQVRPYAMCARVR